LEAMMDHGVMVFAQVMTIVMGSLVAVVGIGLGTRFLWLRGSRTGARSLPARDNREEIERLQTSIDAIAIEVERISEAQRFTVTLLSNRLGSTGADHGGKLPAGGAGARIDTPH
jgi:hypothetical protein